MQIKGIRFKNVSEFIAKIGDISCFTDSKQIQKLAGLATIENSSGKHKRKTKISKCSRKNFRYLLFKAVLLLTIINLEFREIHQYYKNRETNLLKKKQSLMTLENKLIQYVDISFTAIEAVSIQAKHFAGLLCFGDLYRASAEQHNVMRMLVWRAFSQP